MKGPFSEDLGIVSMNANTWGSEIEGSQEAIRGAMLVIDSWLAEGKAPCVFATQETHLKTEEAINQAKAWAVRREFKSVFSQAASTGPKASADRKSRSPGACSLWAERSAFPSPGKVAAQGSGSQTYTRRSRGLTGGVIVPVYVRGAL